MARLSATEFLQWLLDSAKHRSASSSKGGGGNWASQFAQVGLSPSGSSNESGF